MRLIRQLSKISKLDFPENPIIRTSTTGNRTGITDVILNYYFFFLLLNGQ